MVAVIMAGALAARQARMPAYGAVTVAVVLALIGATVAGPQVEVQPVLGLLRIGAPR